MMQILVLVPPTSTNIPFDTLRYSKAPATLAAGPDNIVRIGFVLNVSMLVTPPSPFIIMTGADTPAPLIASSTKFATSNVFGRTLALIAAVNVLISRP